MPKRPKSHQIGEAAIRCFNTLKPSVWVSREKGSDYGVDLEVELFTPQGLDTGLIFNVQSKGTENENVSDKVRIRSETLKYLNSFDVPAIIFRHCSVTNRSYWMWAEHASRKAKADTRSVTIKFDPNNVWDDETPDRIAFALNCLRLLKKREKWTRFPISWHAASPTEVNRYNAFIEPLLMALPFTDQARGSDGIPIHLGLDSGILTLSIATLYETSVVSASDDKNDLAACLCYLLIKLLVDLNFDRHAERAAEYCHAARLIAPSRELSSVAALALLEVPSKAVDLALMNGLQIEQDQYMSLFAAALNLSTRNFDNISNEVIIFFNESIACQKGKFNTSGLSYSLGNYLRSQKKYKLAIRCYNDARKSDSSYLSRTYFYRDLGGILFMSGRYRCASVAYSRLIGMEDTPNARLLLADAYLSQKKYTDAERVLIPASLHPSSIGSEALIKLKLASWLGRIDPNIRLFNYDELFLFRQSFLDCGDNKAAFWSHLVLTFHLENDVECWADAIFLCLVSDNVSIIEDVLKCSLKYCGISAYWSAKAQRPEVFTNLIVAEFDAFVVEANKAVRTERPYRPGETIGEPGILFKQGVLRMEPRVDF
ncbi:DUF4365 domain-containing protein [Rhizobium tumorigenes]|uniref:DUF4365 domain-containing protein n=1 Tax=Rhizobium tumorigenes TaxID=2041385 RepID=A0AAF1KR40_9HYPH|nr:DUF4365 domain-containing protein [Rhizobium tumorigenes]WFR94135.1 DUF4365 domain-containing protein [Rhizobium tumorigenes]